jgi:hypothetical protein
MLNLNKNLRRIIYYSHLFKPRELYSNKVPISSVQLTTRDKYKDKSKFWIVLVVWVSWCISRDGNGDPIPDYPRGIPLLGDGDGTKIIPMGM